MKKHNDRNFVIAIVIISWLYAFIRYNILKGIAFAHLPLYVTNKSMAISAIIILSTAAITFGEEGEKSRNYLNTIGFLLVILHVIMSVVVLNKSYFDTMFYKGRLTALSELALLVGILAFISFFILFLNRIASDKFRTTLGLIFNNNFISILGLIFLLFHTFFIGFKSWLNPEKWPGYLPPITLIGFVIGVIPLVTKFAKREKTKRR